MCLLLFPNLTLNIASSLYLASQVKSVTNILSLEAYTLSLEFTRCIFIEQHCCNKQACLLSISTVEFLRKQAEEGLILIER